LVIRLFTRKEAVLASRTEGPKATPHEIGNYVKALEYGLRHLDSLLLSLRSMCELHERLMRGVRGDNAMPGEFRRVQNWTGSPGSTLKNALYVTPLPIQYQRRRALPSS